VNIGLRFDYVRGMEIGPGYVVLDDTTSVIPATSLAGATDGLVYLAVEQSGAALVVHDPDVMSWDRDQWGAREPLFLGVVRGGELGLVEAALVVSPPDGPELVPGAPPVLLRDLLAAASAKRHRPALLEAPGLRSPAGARLQPLLRLAR
jgi:hypothetical protein